MTTEEVSDVKRKGYNPWSYYESNAELREAIDLIGSGFFSGGDSHLFKPFADALLYHDEYLALADYASYIESQEQVNQAYRDQDRWTRMSILNVARMGKFSSDRSIREYREKIWKVEPVPIPLK